MALRRTLNIPVDYGVNAQDIFKKKQKKAPQPYRPVVECGIQAIVDSFNFERTKFF